MKTKSIKTLLGAWLGVSLLAAPALANSATANTSQLVDLVLEKRIMGDLHSGNRPMINPQNYRPQDFTAAQGQKTLTVSAQQPRVAGYNAVSKTYEVASEPEHYQSLIRVYDAAGNQSAQISVGRRIQALLPSPHSNRLYVLCGGYFGSVWEVDTTRDVVLRKLPDYTPGYSSAPLWNPKNMALMPDGQTLAVGSGKLRLIDLKSGQIQQEIDLPEPAVEVASLQALSADKLGVGLRDAKGGLHRFHLKLGERHLTAGGGASGNSRALRAQVATFSAPPPSIARLFFMASRNNDYVTMIDRESMQIQGVLPVDFNVDDLTLSPDRKRLFVYNRRFGQVSVIELNTRAPESFSVIKRYQDKRFRSDKPLQLGAAAGQVFLWDGENDVIAGFDAFTLYPRMGVSFGERLSPANARVWVSMPAHQRFYLSENRLYAEFMDSAPSSLPMELELGSPVVDLQLSNDRRRLYALTESSELVAMDSMTHDVLHRVNLGKRQSDEGVNGDFIVMRPRYLSVSSDDKRLSVIDADQGSVRILSAVDLVQQKEYTMDIGRDSAYQITLYDPRLTQVIEVELPRHLSDVVRVTQ